MADELVSHSQHQHEDTTPFVHCSESGPSERRGVPSAADPDVAQSSTPSSNSPPQAGPCTDRLQRTADPTPSVEHSPNSSRPSDSTPFYPRSPPWSHVETRSVQRRHAIAQAEGLDNIPVTDPLQEVPLLDFLGRTFQQDNSSGQDHNHATSQGSRTRNSQPGEGVNGDTSPPEGSSERRRRRSQRKRKRSSSSPSSEKHRHHKQHRRDFDGSSNCNGTGLAS